MKERLCQQSSYYFFPIIIIFYVANAQQSYQFTTQQKSILTADVNIRNLRGKKSGHRFFK